MAMSNAERQRRYIARLKALAGVAQPQSPKPDGPKTIRAEVVLPMGLSRRIEAWCKRHNISTAEGIRRLCREQLDSKR
jgi:hypothetical protein